MQCLGKANVHGGVFREKRAVLGCVLPTVGSLCKQKDPECDKETSECTDFDGVALCQCKSGYFKYNKMDHSCRGIALYAAFLFWPEFCLIIFFPPAKKVVHVCVCLMHHCACKKHDIMNKY